MDASTHTHTQDSSGGLVVANVHSVSVRSIDQVLAGGTWLRTCMRAHTHAYTCAHTGGMEHEHSEQYGAAPPAQLPAEYVGLYDTFMLKLDCVRAYRCDSVEHWRQQNEISIRPFVGVIAMCTCLRMSVRMCTCVYVCLCVCVHAVCVSVCVCTSAFV